MVVAADMRRFVERFAELIEQNADTLTELDAAIGDADHGINMRRGVRAVLERLGDEPTPGAVLKTVATTLISKVGGASGPLYGTAFLRASAAAGSKEPVFTFPACAQRMVRASRCGRASARIRPCPSTGTRTTRFLPSPSSARALSKEL